MRLLFSILFLLFSSLALAQSFRLGDTLQTEFAKPDGLKIIKGENDLNYAIRFKNICNRPIPVYSQLVLERSPSILGNFDCELYKKTKENYEQVNYYATSSAYPSLLNDLYITYGDKADSVITRYDMKKKTLAPSMSKSITFNLLHECHFLDAGEYKFKIRLRVKTNYSEQKGRLNVDKIDYIESDWIEFKLLNDLRSSELIENK